MSKLFTPDVRTNSRIVALINLFGNDFLQELKIVFTSPSFKNVDYNKEKSRSLQEGVKKHQVIADQLITKYAVQRPLEDMDKVEINILRLAIVETFILEQVPYKVGIDEAIELAKQFAGASSHRLINGVLGSIATKEIDNLVKYREKHGLLTKVF